MDVFKKQSTQKISNQKMKLKERDKSILEYVHTERVYTVQCTLCMSEERFGIG